MFDTVAAVIDFFRETRQWWILQDIGYAGNLLIVGIMFLLFFWGDWIVFSRKKQCEKCKFEEDIKNIVWVCKGQKNIPVCKFCLSEFMKEGKK